MVKVWERSKTSMHNTLNWKETGWERKALWITVDSPVMVDISGLGWAALKDGVGTEGTATLEDILTFSY